MSINFSQKLTTERLYLERFKESDLKFYLKLTSDPLVKQYFASWKTLEDCKNYFENEIIPHSQSTDDLYLVIRKSDDNMPIGLINLFYHENGAWIVEYVILEAHRNKGYIKEVLKTIIKFSRLFRTVFNVKNELSSLEFNIQPNNDISKKVIHSLEKNLGLYVAQSQENYYIKI
jgi:RimJ/RimL family protein N-acetyltransferase